MKGYKAFEKGLICRGKQYAENTVFEEDEAVICEKGMHFCKNPFDILDYYPLVNDKGDFSDFAEVEALDEPVTDNNKKFSSKKLKIGAKLSFSKFVEAMASFEFEKIGKTKVKTTNKDSAKIGSAGDYAQIGSSGYAAQIGSAGYSAQIGSAGYSAQIGSSGYSAQIGSAGDYAKIGSSGYAAQIGSAGYSAQIGSAGYYAQIGSSGNYAQIGSSGNSAKIGSAGDYAQIGSSGDNAKIGSSGDDAQITSEGKYSVICCAGNGSIAKGKVGSWITLSEWEFDKNEDCYIPVCVKTEKIDGVKIKADTFYKLKNGKFVEVKE